MYILKYSNKFIQNIIKPHFNLKDNRITSFINNRQTIYNNRINNALSFQPNFLQYNDNNKITFIKTYDINFNIDGKIYKLLNVY